MTDIGILFLAILGVMLTGRSLLTLIDRICGTLLVPRTPSEVWGISILMGVSFTAAAGFVWSDIGRPLTAAFAWRQCLIGSLLGILATVQAWRRKSSESAKPLDSSSPFLTRLFRITLGLVLLGAFVLSFAPPVSLLEEDDEPHLPPADRIEITRKAGVLLQFRSIDSPQLVPPGGYPFHFREPLLLPLAERHVSTLLGRPGELAAAIWSPLCLAGMALSFLGVLSRRTTRAWGAILTTGLIVMPCFWSPVWGIPARIADVPLAAFGGVAVLLMWDAMQDSPGRIRIRSLLLASGMASSACFTKSEGLVILETISASWVLVACLPVSSPDPGQLARTGSARRQDLLAIVIFLLFAAFLLTPWMLYRHSLPVTADSVRYQPLSLARLSTHLLHPIMLPDLFGLMGHDWWKTGLPWGLLIAAGVSSPRRLWARPQRFVISTLLMTGAVAEFVLIPAGLKDHLRGSMEPWLLHLTPLVMLLIATAWSPAGPALTAGQPESSPLKST